MQTRTWIPSGDSLTAAKWEGSSRHCWEKTVLALLCATTRSLLSCYSWCGFPFRCLENDSADHIHILKYFLRTCNQTAGTDSFLQCPATTQLFQRGRNTKVSEHRQKSVWIFMGGGGNPRAKRPRIESRRLRLGLGGRAEQQNPYRWNMCKKSSISRK